MNKLFAVSLAVGMGLGVVPAVSQAADHQVECVGSACNPFVRTNSYVVSLAVSTAQNTHAVVGDTISEYYVPPPGNTCEERWITYKVNRTPVYNSSQLTYQESICLIAKPEHVIGHGGGLGPLSIGSASRLTEVHRYADATERPPAMWVNQMAFAAATAGTQRTPSTAPCHPDTAARAIN